VEDVGVGNQIFTSVCLNCLVKETLGSKSCPSFFIRSMKHLLRSVELLNVLRQPVFGGVDLSTGFTDQCGGGFNVTVFSSELSISKKHCQLSPYDAFVILRKSHCAELTWIGCVSMLAIMLQYWLMITKGLRMFVIPMSHQTSVRGVKFATNCTMM
jgi:hypothetical protein